MFQPNTYRNDWHAAAPDLLAGRSRGRAGILLPWDTRKVRPVLTMGIGGLDAEMAAREVGGGVEFDLPDKVFGQLSRARWESDEKQTRLVLVLDRCPTFPHPGLPIDLGLPPDAKLYYQPALTPQEIEMGAERPEEVIGSWAIYGKFGKLGHLYPGWWTDARGERCKAVLRWDGVQLWLELPQAWMQSDSRAWPVTKNATLGWTGTGGSSDTLNGRVRGFGPFQIAEGGTATSVNIYGIAGGYDQALGIYGDTSGVPVTWLGDTANIAPWVGTTWSGDKNLDSSVALTANTPYWLASFSVYIRYYYDTVAGFTLYYKSATYNNDGVLPSPFGSSPSSLADSKVSIYATYTPAAAGHPAIKRFGGIPFTRQFGQGVQVW